MLVLGLTGGIAMGKSHAARLFRAHGVPVFDSDAAVHRLLQPGGAAVASVIAAFPGTLDGRGGIDRKALGARVFGDAQALVRLEKILHPLVRQAQARFLARFTRQGAPLAVLDVPLLLETSGERRVDRVVVVSAPRLIQRLRALRRPGMTPERLAGILTKQMPDGHKVRRADALVRSGCDRGTTAAAVRGLVLDATMRRPRAWPDRWLRASFPGDTA